MVSIVSTVLAVRSEKASKDLQIRTFQRQGVIDLYGHWADVRDIDLTYDEQIDPQITRAIHMLELTSALWHHDIVEKEILVQGFWKNVKKFYEKLNQPNIKLKHRNDQPAQDSLSEHVQKCYEEMRHFKLSKTEQSKLGGEV